MKGWSFPLTPCVMDPYLRALIRGGETGRVEFKRSASNLPKIARCISAFANTKGGLIVVGLEDNGQPVGIQFEEERFLLEKALTQYASPPLLIDYRRLRHYQEVLLLARIPESNTKPVLALTKSGEWQSYIREGANCLQAPPEALAQFRQENEALQKRSPFRGMEKQLFEYFDRREAVISLKHFARLVGTSVEMALRVLNGLLSQGRIRSYFSESGDVMVGMA